MDDDTITPVGISGTIRLSNNSPFAGAAILLSGTQTAQTTTDSNGVYSFANLPSSGNYTITPSAINYTFAPVNRQFTNLTSDAANTDFTAAFAPAREITVISSTTTPGQNVFITVDLVSQGNERKVAFSLDYDSSLVFNPQVVTGSGAQAATLAVNNSPTGKVGISLTLPAGQTFAAGTRQMIVITFNTAQTGATNTPINFDDTPIAREVLDVNSNEMTSGYNNGAVFFQQGFEADAASRPNGDGVIQSDDVVQVQRFSIGLDSPNQSNEIQRADSAPFNLRGDGVIQSDDVVQTQRYQIGLDPKQNASGPVAPVAMISAEESSAKSDENYAENKTTSAAFAPREVRVENVSTSAGQQVVVNIRADAVGDESAYGFQMNFDQTKLIYVSQMVGIVGSSRLCNTIVAGQITCSVNNFPANQTGSSTSDIGEIPEGNNQIILKITFTAANALPGMIPVTISNVNASNDSAQNLTPITPSSGAVTILGTTAAAVSISGKILTTQGKGIGNARVTMTDSRGAARTTISTAFGYFRFDDLAAGETYILTARHKTYRFDQSSQIITLLEDRENLNFTAVK